MAVPIFSIVYDHLWALSLALFLPLAFYSLWSAWNDQSHIPGPFLASLTNLPRLWWSYSGTAHLTHIQLHEQYGDLVRIGPGCISVGDPREISKIYGISTNYQKSDFYRVLQPMARGNIVQGLFNTQDDKLHRAMKKPISALYSMSSVVQFEPYVDTTIEFFFKRLEEVQKSDSRQSCDLGTWLQWYAFDVMGEVTFSKRLGFLDEAKDVDGIMATIWKHFQFCSVVGQMPWLDYIWAKNKFVNRMLPSKMHPVIAFALARARERTQKPRSLEDAKPDKGQNSQDFMSRFIEIKANDPSIPEWYVTAWAYSNVLAGSDTTAIMLRAIIYFLIRNPISLSKLMTELTQARSEGRLSKIVTWVESRRLNYLDACVKEAGRLHPAIGLPMERVVPEGGAEICGKHFKAGTVVGMNPWVIHRSKDIFGPDVYEWNPDRWLGDEVKRREMERCLLTFGMGHRTCIGKNISYLEIYKLIPTMFARYNMELADPTREWHLANSWLVVQTGLEVKLRRKEIL